MTFYSINLDREEAIALRNAVAWTLATCCGAHRGALDFCDTCELLQGIGGELDRVISKPAVSATRADGPALVAAERSSVSGSVTRSAHAGREHLMLLPTVAHD